MFEMPERSCFLIRRRFFFMSFFQLRTQRMMMTPTMGTMLLITCQNERRDWSFFLSEARTERHVRRHLTMSEVHSCRACVLRSVPATCYRCRRGRERKTRTSPSSSLKDALCIGKRCAILGALSYKSAFMDWSVPWPASECPPNGDRLGVMSDPSCLLPSSIDTRRISFN